MNERTKKIMLLVGVILLAITSLYLILKPTVIDHFIINPRVVESATADMVDVDTETLQKNQKRIHNVVEKSEPKLETNADGYSYPVTTDPSISYDASAVSAIGEIPKDAALNYDYMIGEIYMPRVGMHVPILEGMSNENLWLGAGTMKPGQTMGKDNYALAGHHMWDASQLFTPIMNSEIGDVVYVTDKSNVYEYKVSNMFVAQEKDGHLVNDVEAEQSESGAILTMVTCTDVWGSERYIVVAELSGQYSIDEAPQELQDLF